MDAFAMKTVFYRLGCTALRPTTRSLYPETRLLSTSAPTALKNSYKNIQVEQKEPGVGLIRLHRPKAMNALSDALFQDLIHAATALDQDDSVGCLVLTGSTKAFAAGADIAEMKDRTFDYTYKKVRGQLQCRVCVRVSSVRYMCRSGWLQVSHNDTPLPPVYFLQ
jgi:1,4-dihydroxy-2-naphthoyl-CoA synthase